MSATDPLRKLLRVVRLSVAASDVALLIPPGDDHAGDGPVLISEGSAEVTQLFTDVAAATPGKRGDRSNVGHGALVLQGCATPVDRVLRIDLRQVTTWMQAALPDERRRERTASPLVDTLWLALRFPSAAAAQVLDRAVADNQTEARTEGAAWTIAASAFLAVGAFEAAARIVDATVGLPGRMEFQAWLGPALQRCAERGTALGLILVNPDDFASVNHRFGHEVGDGTLLEVANQLTGLLRDEDRVYRYGGAVFAVVLTDVQPQEVQAAAERLRTGLSGRRYLNNAVQLSFSCGTSLFCAGDSIDLAEMVRRADRALNVAKLGGGCRAILWKDDDDSMRGVGSIDRLSGIFTADASRDYRNMLLLWETISVVSAGTSVDAIGHHFVERLQSAFGLRRVLLVAREDAGQRLLAASGDGADQRTLQPAEAELIAAAQASQQIERTRSPDGRYQWVMPLPGSDVAVGWLAISGSDTAFDSEDLMFLDALVRQVGMSLERAQLARRWRESTDLERRALREEVRELRQGLQHARLVYCSSAMEAVLDVLRQVAGSDATVLICGESGTGKEMLARTLHDHSPRRDAPFVTVDCGAIAGNLLEAELFGRHKGAYTGADSAAKGLIAQAEGGTLFLDEIGEVPLELQSKLLRFVQEKEITPLGSSSTRRVDVRIVSATNRNLADEVSAGRYRADLYYRLQVITVVAPPLRERREDIMPLAHYFMDKFAVQYARQVRSLSPAAEERLRAHNWPGNVRELQSCMMRSVLLAGDDVLDADHLELGERPLGLRTITGGLADMHAPGALPAAPGRVPQVADNGVGPAVAEPGDPWQVLRAELDNQVCAALQMNRRNPAPVGRWLREDLVLAAQHHDGEVMRRAADALGMAETTFRRQLAGIEREQEIGALRRFEPWQPVAELINERFNQLVAGGGDVIARARNVLLEVVLERVDGASRAQGAALMGVSPPTYRRLVADVAA